MTPTFPITSSNVEPALGRPMILLQALLKRTTGTVALPSLPNVMGITQRRSAVVVVGIYRSPDQDDPSVSRNLEIAHQAGPGNGFVDVFDNDGHLLERLITQGQLNSPWGLAPVPREFGEFRHKFGGFGPSVLLVGNFGDGKINAFVKYPDGRVTRNQDAPITHLRQFEKFVGVERLRKGQKGLGTTFPACFQFIAARLKSAEAPRRRPGSLLKPAPGADCGIESLCPESWPRPAAIAVRGYRRDVAIRPKYGCKDGIPDRRDGGN